MKSAIIIIHDKVAYDEYCIGSGGSVGRYEAYIREKDHTTR